MFSDDEKEVEIERAKNGIQSKASEHWAEVVGLFFILAFIFGLVYLAHNHWAF